MSELLTVPLEQIDPPAARIRQHMPEDLLDELAQSIHAVGLIEPLVCERNNGRFRIIAGERRYLACKRAGVGQVEIVVRDVAAASVEAVQEHENIFRFDMTPVEEARLFKRFYDAHGEDLELTAGHFKLSVGYVDSRLALLFGDPEIAAALDSDAIGLGVAQQLNKITREDYRRAALDQAIRGGATENLVKRWVAEYNGLAQLQGGPPAPARPDPQPSAAGSAPAPLCCWFCEGTENIHELVQLPVHTTCVAALEAMLKKIGRS